MVSDEARTHKTVNNCDSSLYPSAQVLQSWEAYPVLHAHAPVSSLHSPRALPLQSFRQARSSQAEPLKPELQAHRPSDPHAPRPLQLLGQEVVVEAAQRSLKGGQVMLPRKPDTLLRPPAFGQTTWTNAPELVRTLISKYVLLQLVR